MFEILTIAATVFLAGGAQPAESKAGTRSTPAQSTTANPALLLTDAEPGRLVFIEHTGAYWTLGQKLDRVRNYMAAHELTGRVFVLYQTDPLTTSADRLDMAIGFLTQSEHQPEPPFKSAERPDARVARMAASNSRLRLIPACRTMNQWASENGYQPVGPVFEFFDTFQIESRGRSGRRVIFEMPVVEIPPTVNAVEAEKSTLDKELPVVVETDKPVPTMETPARATVKIPQPPKLESTMPTRTEIIPVPTPAKQAAKPMPTRTAPNATTRKEPKKEKSRRIVVARPPAAPSNPVITKPQTRTAPIAPTPPVATHPVIQKPAAPETIRTPITRKPAAPDPIEKRTPAGENGISDITGISSNTEKNATDSRTLEAPDRKSPWNHIQKNHEIIVPPADPAASRRVLNEKIEVSNVRLFKETPSQQLARRLLPDAHRIRPELQIWLGQVVFRLNAIRKGVDRLLDGEDSGASILVGDVINRYDVVSTSFVGDPLARSTVMTDRSNRARAEAQKSIMRDLDQLLGSVAARRVNLAETETELLGIMTRAAELVELQIAETR